jgi:hypothetical protein
MSMQANVCNMPAASDESTSPGYAPNECKAPATLSNRTPRETDMTKTLTALILAAFAMTAAQAASHAGAAPMAASAAKPAASAAKKAKAAKKEKKAEMKKEEAKK